MTQYPLAIIGDGRIVTRDGTRPYPTQGIIHVTQLAEIALTSGAPLGALWIQPGTDLERAATRLEQFWSREPGWRIFTTGTQGGAVGYATIRRDGADVHGMARREVRIYADLPGRWRLGGDFAGEDGARRLLETVLCAEWALAQGLKTLTEYPDESLTLEYSPAHSALDLLRLLCGSKAPARVGWLAPLSAATLADLPWPRPMTPMHVNRQPRDGQYVHVYDKNAAYLAACSRRFGRGEPVHVSCEEITVNDDLQEQILAGKAYGIWRVCGYRWPHPLPEDEMLPGPFGAAHEIEDMWVYTPHIELAKKLGWDLTIYEGYYWPNTHGALAEWAQCLWQARQAARTYSNHAPAAEGLLKHCFTESLGVMARRPEVDAGEAIRWYNRPDWAGTITAEHYLRHVLKMHQLEAQTPGYLYVSGKDSFAWISDDPDPMTAVPGLLDKPQTQLGSYKHVVTLAGEDAQLCIMRARDCRPLSTITSVVATARRESVEA